MTNSAQNSISDKYCPRFGQLAVEMKYITPDQLKEALCCQIEEELAGEKRRLLGAILYSKDWMTSEQVEHVMNALLKKMRKEGEGNK